MGPVFVKPEGSQFCQSGGVLFLPIRRGTIFASPEGYYFANPKGACFFQSRWVLFLSNRKVPNFANLEGSCFCQSGGVLFLPVRRGTILPIRWGTVITNPEGFCFANPDGSCFCQEKIIVKGIRLLGDRLGTSDCTGNLPFNKRRDQNKTGLISDIRDTKFKLKTSLQLICVD